MYAKKNSITLACLLVLVLTIAFFWYRSETKELESLKKEEIQLNQKLSEHNLIASTLQEVDREYKFLKEKWENADKVLIAADEPAFSYHYLNKIITEKRIAFDFDFILSNQTVQRSFSSFSYTLEGEGSFVDVYKLIWYLTVTPILYKIKSVHFDNVDANGDLIKFVIKLQSYSMAREWSLAYDKKTTEDFNVPTETFNLNYNSFKPLIYQPKKTTTSVSRPQKRSSSRKRSEKKLFDIHKATLQAVMIKKILINDQKGMISTLSLGDKVKDGYLSRIDLDKSEAEFIMEGHKALILGLGYLREGGKIRANDEGRVYLK